LLTPANDAQAAGHHGENEKVAVVFQLNHLEPMAGIAITQAKKTIE